jgi:MFS family permease
VWALGWVAFFNDTSSEMSYWLLPQFLVSVLGASPMAFGFIEGAAETVASVGRLVSGLLSDRWRRRKPLAAAGYTVANVAKPWLAIVSSWPQVFWIRFADRAAKGFRAAPRDALIADSVPPSERGAAFGFRQSMDTAGAIVGPLAAALLLPLFFGNARWVFALAAVPGSISVMLAWFAVREVRRDASPKGHSVADTVRAQIRGPLLPLLVAIAVFSLGNSSDLFLILRAENLGLSPTAAPVLGLVFNVVYAALSWPAGRLSDRFPRRALVVGGFVVYGAAYAGFAFARTPRAVWFLFPLYGLYYALTEGVLKAWIADRVPSAALASAYGVFSWVVGVTALPASLAAGWLWRHVAPSTPFYVSSVLAFLAAALALIA